MQTTITLVERSSSKVLISADEQILLDVPYGQISQLAQDGLDLVITLSDGSEIVLEGFYLHHETPVLLCRTDDGDVFEITLHAPSQSGLIGFESRPFVMEVEDGSLSQLTRLSNGEAASHSIEGAEAFSGIALAGFALASGGGGAEGGSSDSFISVTGTAVAGPVVDGHSLVAQLFVPGSTTPLASVDLDSQGGFTVEITPDMGIPVGSVLMIQVTDTSDDTLDYRDEATGENVDLTLNLQAVVVVEEGQNVISINPLTTIAVREMGLGLDDFANEIGDSSELTVEQVNQQNTLVAERFGLGVGKDVTREPVIAVITQEGGANTQANDYGKILAAISGIEKVSEGDTGSVIDALVTSGSSLSDDQKQSLLVGAQAAMSSAEDTIANDVAELLNIDQSIADEILAAVDSINSFDGSAGTEPSADDYTTLGVSGVTAANLDAVNAAIAASTDTSLTPAEITAIVAAVDSINSFDGSAGTEPSADDYTTLGVSGVTAANLDAVNAAIAASADTSLTPAEITAIVAAVNRINSFDGSAGTDPSADDYTALGVSGVTAENLDAVNAAIAASADTSLTPAEITAIVAAVDSINSFDGTAGTDPSADDYATLGVSGVTAENLDTVNAAIAASADTSLTPAEIQAIVNSLLVVTLSVSNAGELSGTAEAGATITLYDAAGDVVATTVADGSTGAWDFSPNPLGEGLTGTLTATDDAGNEGAETAIAAVDATAPDMLTATLRYDSGPFTYDGVTNDGVLLIGDTLEAGATWQYSLDSEASWIEGTGTDFTLPEGEYAESQIAIRQVDSAGNPSNSYHLPELTIDVTVPDDPTVPLATYVDDIGSETSAASTAMTTDDNQPSFNIGAGLTDSPVIYVDGLPINSIYDPVEGTLTPAIPIEDGTYDFSYAISDDAGNVSGQSNVLTLEILTGPVPIIDLAETGLGGQLILPIEVNIKDTVRAFYAWDKNKDGYIDSNDVVTHNTLDSIFNSGADTTNQIDTRKLQFGDLELLIPTLGDPNHMDGTQPPLTSYTGTSISSPTESQMYYDDYLAIWDAFNGGATGTTDPATIDGWALDQMHWSATSAGTENHAPFRFDNARTSYNPDSLSRLLILEVV